jgi:AcrR family transcriptional regulator
VTDTGELDRAPLRTSERRKIGRPARLDREMIARAAHDIGLDHVTMKAVADKLGVSVPGLYHHVDGRDDLMQLAAEYSASQIQLPTDRNQHWTAWLLEWARYSHDAFVAQPELLSQFLNGSIGVDRMLVHVDAAIGLLMRHGFSAEEALNAYNLVSACAIGIAVGEIRTAEAARAGRPIIAEYHRALSQRETSELPHLRTLVGAINQVTSDFDDRIRTVLAGIAVRRGESVENVLDPTSSTATPPASLHP